MALADDLLDVAGRLLSGWDDGGAGLRRAVSTAYYALFHAALTAAADRFIGPGLGSVPAYQLVYRAYDHGRMRQARIAVAKPLMTSTTQGYLGRQTSSEAVREFADAFVTLQKARHEADYAPASMLTLINAQRLVDYAREGVAALAAVPEIERLDFLAFMLVEPRR